MPFQTFDFSKMPLLKQEKPDYSWISNLLPNFLEGYHKPKEMKEARELAKHKIKGAELGNISSEHGIKAQEMANRIMELYGDKEAQAKLRLLEGQASNFERLGRGEGLGRGSAGGGGGLGSSSMDMRQGLNVWRSLPQNVRNDMIAEARGNGIPTEQFVEGFIQGKSLEDMLGERNLENNGEKYYAPTQANITQIKNQLGAESELEVLQEFATEGMKKYGGRNFLGYSPEQFIDAITNKNHRVQGKFLAARAIQTELAGVRSKLAGGSNAHEALKGLKADSLGDIKIFRPLVSSEAWQYAQEELNDVLKRGSAARHKAMTHNPGTRGFSKENTTKEDLNRSRNMDKFIGQEEKTRNALQGDQQGMVTGTLNGKIFKIPASEAADFQREGGMINE